MGIFTLRRKRKNNNIWFNIFCEDSVFIKINIDKTNFFLIHNIGEYLYFYLLKRIFFSCVHMLPKTRKKFNLLYCCVTHTNNAKFFFNVSLLIAVYNYNMSNTHIFYLNVIISWYKSLLYALNVYKPYIQHLIKRCNEIAFKQTNISDYLQGIFRCETTLSLSWYWYYKWLLFVQSKQEIA